MKDVNALAQEYGKQLSLYKNAVEQSMGLQVSHCLIYSIALGEETEAAV